jgi:hypothetical protein
MKLSNETLNVLKNFASINNGMKFKQGNKLSTISSGKTIFVSATIKDEFPQDFCVYDLNQFLAVHSLNKDPEIEFDDSNIIFKSGRSKLTYRKTAENMIVVPPDREVKLPSIDVEFALTEEAYSNVMKSASVLKSTHIAVESDGGPIMLSCYDASDDAQHTNSIEVAESNGKKFKLVFLTDNFKMIPGSYDVQISAKGLGSFKNKNADIQYWVAFESKYSNFEG